MFLDFWRVHPNQDRSAGVCSKRKMTAEEKEKYGPINPAKYTGVADITTNHRALQKRISDEMLLAQMKRHGANWKATDKIAKELGYASGKSIRKRVIDIAKSEGAKC